MTAVFALLAACGVAGLAYSLLKPGMTGQAQSFREALREADGPGQDLARRLELLEENDRGQRESMSAMSGLVKRPGDKINRPESCHDHVPDKEDREEPAREALEVIADAARTRAALSIGLHATGKYRAANHFNRPYAGAAAQKDAEVKKQRPKRPTAALRAVGQGPGVQRSSAFSERMAAVWKASEKNDSPLAIARELSMGVSEVELALKVRKMRPKRG